MNAILKNASQRGLLLLLVLLSAHTRIFAQNGTWSIGTYMQQALIDVVSTATITNVVSGFDYDFDNGTISLLGAFLSEGGKASWNTTLYEGYSYIIIGGGDNEVVDLDIEVFDSSGNRVIIDNKTNRTPMVEIIPEYTQQYRMEITLYEANASSFCSLAILRNGIETFPLESIYQAVDRYLVMVESVDEVVGGANFHGLGNQWTLYGAILNEGESVQISGIRMESRSHVVLAAGDVNAIDIDLYLYDDNDVLIKQDTMADPTPILYHDTSEWRTYKLTLINYDSNGRSLVIATILDI